MGRGAGSGFHRVRPCSPQSRCRAGRRPDRRARADETGDPFPPPLSCDAGDGVVAERPGPPRLRTLGRRRVLLGQHHPRGGGGRAPCWPVGWRSGSNAHGSITGHAADPFDGALGRALSLLLAADVVPARSSFRPLISGEARGRGGCRLTGESKPVRGCGPDQSQAFWPSSCSGEARSSAAPSIRSCSAG